MTPRPQRRTARPHGIRRAAWSWMVVLAGAAAGGAGGAAEAAAAATAPTAAPAPGAVHATPSAAPPARVHEVPADVTVQVYIRPADDRVRLLVRVPLEAMRDVDWPLRGPGYLRLEGLEPLLREAAQIWIADYLTLYEDGAPLGPEQVTAVRLSLPSDRSFRSYDEALAHVRAPGLPATTDIVPQQVLFDVMLEAPIRSATSRFSIEPSLAHLGVETVSVLHFLPPGRGERVFQYDGDPGVVRLDPRWHQAALRFVGMGFLHILDGIDHLLFILCLVIPFRRFSGLVPVVTAFTVAHSITLIAAALGVAPGALWFPPLVETLIAASIVFMALENIVGARVERRWVIAFGFGLVHGFGFSFALSESLQFAGAHLLTSLLAFNVGVELGQLLVILLMVPVLEFAFRRVVPERMGVIVLSALVTHTAWHWMTERGSQLLEYRVAWPVLDGLFVAGLMRAVALLLVCAAAAWALWSVYARMGWAAGADEAGLDPHVT